MANKPEKKKVAFNRSKIMGDAPIVVTEVAEKCLYSGFFGTLDSARMKKVIDRIVELSDVKDAEYMIIDLSNIDIIDTAVVGHLLKSSKLLNVIGVEVLFSGINPMAAQSMINAGIDLDVIDVYKNLRKALQEVYRRQNIELVRINKGEQKINA